MKFERIWEPAPNRRIRLYLWRTSAAERKRQNCRMSWFHFGVHGYGSGLSLSLTILSHGINVSTYRWPRKAKGAAGASAS